MTSTHDNAKHRLLKVNDLGEKHVALGNHIETCIIVVKLETSLSVCSSSMKGLRALRPILSTWRTNIFTKPDAPIKFTTSKSKTWKTEYSRKGIAEEDESVWYQPIVVSASVAIFLLCFCVLREENDIDEEIGRSIYERIDGLEEVQLRRVLEYNLNQGKDTTATVSRLRELEQLRLAKANPE